MTGGGLDIVAGCWFGLLFCAVVDFSGGRFWMGENGGQCGGLGWSVDEDVYVI